VRVLVLSDTFPNRHEPWRGSYNRRQIECLSRLCAVTVINPIPLPRLLSDRKMREVTRGRDDVIEGVATWHPVFRYVPLLGRGRSWAGVAAAARRALGQGAAGDYDIILATFAYPHGAAARALSAKMGIPYAIKARGSDLHALPDRGARRERTAEAVRDAAALMAVSGNLAEIAVRLGADPRHVRVLPNGIDADTFSRKTSRPQARRALGVDPEAPLLLFVGNLLPVKGLDVALRALAESGASCEMARLVIVGDGPMKRQLKRLAAGAGIAERVQFMGRLGRENVALWMKAADVLVLPSRNEGCPNVVLESLASGTPVVASAVGAVPDLLDDSCGFAVPPDDPKALAEAVGRVLSREWNREAIRARVAGMSWEANAARLLEILSGVIAAEPHSGNVLE